MVFLRTPRSANTRTTFNFESVVETWNQRQLFTAIDLNGNSFVNNQNEVKTGERRALSLNK
jgi:hypothetical protein